MNGVSDRIRPLKKVTLSLEAGSAGTSMDLTCEPLQFEFIFGLGREGLTPFEFQLAEKEVGESVLIPVHPERIAQVFGHLRLPFSAFPADLLLIYLKVRILKAEPANQREVIREMAEISTCGGSCCGH
jgi:hypothetical protein